MAIQQKELLFGTAQTLASISSGATSTIGSVVNLGANRDFYDTARNNQAGKSGELWLTILCEETFTSTGTPAITIAFSTKSTSASFSSGATALVTLSSVSVGTTAGTYLYQGVVPAGMLQYCGVNVTSTSGTLSTGTLTMFLSLDADLNA